MDGYARVSGSAVYPSDIFLPGMLYGAILRCPHPHAVIKKVDVAAAAADSWYQAADTVLEETYRTSCELQTPVELHGCVANWDGSRLPLWESSQGVFAVQSTIAATLGLPLARVRAIGHYVGGGFGSKLQPGKYTAICASRPSCGSPEAAIRRLRLSSNCSRTGKLSTRREG